MSINRHVLIPALAGLSMLLGACTTVSVVPQRMDALKSVALVGYSGEVDLHVQNEPSTGVGGAISAIKQTKQYASGELEQRHAEEAQAAYDSLAKKLEAKFGWKVMPREQLGANPDYANRVAQAGKGMGGSRNVPGILSQYAAEKLSPAEREALSKALGVDALVVVTSSTVIGKTSGMSIGGLGKMVKYPRTTLRLSLYDAANPEPAWKDISAQGEAAPTGVENVMGAEVFEKEKQALQEAVDLAIDSLIARYDEAKQKAQAAK